MSIDANEDSVFRLLLATVMCFGIGGFFLIAGFNGQLIVRIRTMQLWVGMVATSIGLYFLPQLFIVAKSLRIERKLVQESAALQSFIQDRDIL